MGPEDAAICFDRHATSKIRTIEDLDAIATMGFRGEALASIAAVAHVELKTRRPGDETGTRIVVEGGRMTVREACAADPGTSIEIRHLFFTCLPDAISCARTRSRRKHIVEEFQRLALARPEVAFRLEHNGIELFHLHPANRRKRVVAVLGKAVNERLVPVGETTSVLELAGFVGKPQNAATYAR